jgi:hypothetical protein
VRAGQLGLAEQFARLLETALMVVADFRNHVARRVIANFMRADSE